MTARNLVSLFVLLGSGSLIACAGDAGPAGPAGPAGSDGPPGEPATLDPSLPTFDKVVAGLGGQTALQALEGYRITASGARYQPGESYAPHGPAPRVGSFELAVAHHRASESFRLDYDRVNHFAGDLPLSYSEIIHGKVGAVDGNDSILGFPTGDMLSSRWAATVKQQALLNPHGLVLDVLAEPTRATEAGTALHDGVIHEILEIDHPVAPIRLWVRPSTGHIAKLTTLENDHLHRDSALEAHYDDWQRVADGPAFPQEVYLVLGEEILHEERRVDIEINPDFAAGTFELPEGSQASHDGELASWGEHSSQFHNQFAALGIALDFVQSFVQPVELAPGVYHLTGGTHHSLVVEQSDGLVVVEPPLYPERSQAVIEWASTALSGKPVTHVVITHHHEDHSAGAREYVAHGAVVVAAENARELLAEIFAAPSTVVPDGLEAAQVAPVFQTVPLFGTVVLADANNPVEVHFLPNPHASDMVVAFLPNGGFLFESDLFNPGNGGSSFGKPLAQALFDGVAGLNVQTLVGGHGGTGPLSELSAWIANH
jgi:glyoxylase-like metal-dependent hydrolase (beta-lactamase superfamily II)